VLLNVMGIYGALKRGRLGEGLGKNRLDFPEFHGANHGKKAGKSCMVSLF
jgi:hypothetical protein